MKSSSSVNMDEPRPELSRNLTARLPEKFFGNSPTSASAPPSFHIPNPVTQNYMNHGVCGR